MTRFELATPRPPDVCATGLRYIPNQVGKSNGKCQDFKNLIKSIMDKPVKSLPTQIHINDLLKLFLLNLIYKSNVNIFIHVLNGLNHSN